MTRKMKIVTPVLVLVAGFVVMIFLLNLKSAPAKRAPEPRPKVVETEVVALTDIPSEIIAYGTVVSSQPVQLFSEVNGTILAGEVPFRPAQSFSRGDLLLRIDDRQAQFDLNSAKSDLLNALATLLPEIKIDFPEEYPVWQAYFNGCEFGEKLAELPKAANEKIKLYLSRFHVYKLYFTVRDLEILLEKYSIRAPFDGSIVSTALRVGSAVHNGSLLGEIINLEDLEVEVPVPAADISWIDHRKPVTFTSTEIPGSWTGTIVRIGSEIDLRSQTVQVFIAAEPAAGDRLLDGDFLAAQIPGKLIANAIAVPRRAVYEDNYVYLIVDGKLEYRKVSIARRQDRRIIVNGGLHNGDTLITIPMQGVVSGMPAVPRIAAGEGQGA